MDIRDPRARRDRLARAATEADIPAAGKHSRLVVMKAPLAMMRALEGADKGWYVPADDEVHDWWVRWAATLQAPPEGVIALPARWTRKSRSGAEVGVQAGVIKEKEKEREKEGKGKEKEKEGKEKEKEKKKRRRMKRRMEMIGAGWMMMLKKRMKGTWGLLMLWRT
jgi:hypothetical protein